MALGLAAMGGGPSVVGADDLTVIADEHFCELVADDVPACEAALRIVAADRAVPASLAALLTEPEPSGAASATAPEPGSAGTGAPAEDWTVFVVHVGESASAIGALLRDAARAADDFALDQLEATLSEIVGRAEAELDWLEVHPPATCFAEHHAAWQETSERLQEAAGSTLRGVRERDPKQLEDGVEGLAAFALEVPRTVDELERQVGAGTTCP